MEEELKKIYEDFKRNLLGAAIISEVKEENLPSGLLNLKEDLIKLDNEIGIENLNKNQSVVLIISAFECFFREFFTFIIEENIPTRKMFVKIMKNKEFKDLNLERLYNICEGKINLGNIICERCSFTSMNELEKLFEYIGIDFNDLFELHISDEDENKKEIENVLNSYPINKGRLENIVFIRNKFIHEGIVSPIDMAVLDSLIISLQLIAAKLICFFLKKQIPFSYFLKYPKS